MKTPPKPPKRVWVTLNAAQAVDANGSIAIFRTRRDAAEHARDENKRFCGEYGEPVAYVLEKP